MRLLLLVCVYWFGSVFLFADVALGMTVGEVSLWPEGEAPVPAENASAKMPGPEQSTGPGNDRWVTGTTVPTLTMAIPDADRRSGAAVVICPGGGYAGLAFDKEGLNVGRWLAAQGIATFTLKYRQGGGALQHPVPLMDVQRALRWVRNEAEQWQLDTKKIGVCGFSAGGHLASCAATLFDEGDAGATDPVSQQSSRPDFAILAYPVISMELKVTHAGSRRHLLGSRRDKELIAQLSTDRQVSERTPPTFLVHSADDDVVLIENSLRFYRALLQHKVPAELHAYERGGHGFGMLQRGLPVDDWPRALEGWLKQQKLMK